MWGSLSEYEALARRNRFKDSNCDYPVVRNKTGGAELIGLGTYRPSFIDRIVVADSSHCASPPG